MTGIAGCCARRERPRGGCAKERDELASFYLIELRSSRSVRAALQITQNVNANYQTRQRIRARSEIVTHWPMIITARPPSLSFMLIPYRGPGEAVISADRARRFDTLRGAPARPSVSAIRTASIPHHRTPSAFRTLRTMLGPLGPSARAIAERQARPHVSNWDATTEGAASVGRPFFVR